MRVAVGVFVRVVAVVGLAWYFVAGATEHARTVNTFAARADQTGYLWDAQVVYSNWHPWYTPPLHRGDQTDYPAEVREAYLRQHGPGPLLVGQRMRMPVYAGFLALAYEPWMSDAEFFDVAKRWNIRLALALLGLLAILFFRHLPRLAAVNLTLAVGFGYFVFRAGYSQPELLFYTLFFAAFLACWHLLRRSGGPGAGALGALAGALAGLAFLTKAVILPFVGLFLVVYAANAVWLFLQSHRAGPSPAGGPALRALAWRVGAATALGLSFLAVVSPYIVHSKRAFGSYFFNANTTYYMWYDSGVVARAILWPHTDAQGRIVIATRRVPDAHEYWKTHTPRQIAARITDGLWDTLVRSYRTFWYLKYVLMYVGFVLLLATAGRRHLPGMLRDHAALVVFLLLYAGVYLVGVGFFVVISDTGGTRFLLAHIAPLLFVCAHVMSRTRLSAVSLGSARPAERYFQLALLAVIACDLAFTIWPRLMTTYAGF